MKHCATNSDRGYVLPGRMEGSQRNNAERIFASLERKLMPLPVVLDFTDDIVHSRFARPGNGFCRNSRTKYRRTAIVSLYKTRKHPGRDCSSNLLGGTRGWRRDRAPLAVEKRTKWMATQKLLIHPVGEYNFHHVQGVPKKVPIEDVHKFCITTAIINLRTVC